MTPILPIDRSAEHLLGVILPFQYLAERVLGAPLTIHGEATQDFIFESATTLLNRLSCLSSAPSAPLREAFRSVVRHQKLAQKRRGRRERIPPTESSRVQSHRINFSQPERCSRRTPPSRRLTAWAVGEGNSRPRFWFTFR